MALLRSFFAQACLWTLLKAQPPPLSSAAEIVGDSNTRSNTVQAPSCAALPATPAASAARWCCALSQLGPAAAAAERGGGRVRFRSYQNKTGRRRNGPTPTYGGQAARATFQYFGWQETRGDDWDLLWTGRGQYDFMRRAGLRGEPAAGRRHNHCFSSGLLAGNKKSLVKRHNAMVDMFGAAEFAHIPETFELPYQYEELLERMEEEKTNAVAAAKPARSAGSTGGEERPLWILKPTLGARGEGIELLWEPDQVPERGENTVQRYISSAYLIDGRKVHLRLYLAITEIEPLRLLLLREGLVLFANQPYNTSVSALGSKQVHLTNAAVARPSSRKGASRLNPKQDALEASYDSGGDPDKSYLTWSLRPFLQHLQDEGVDVSALWSRVEAALIKTILTGQALQRLPQRRPGSCVDLFGIDVMFDTDLVPYVLEVNLAPALNSAQPGVNQRVHDRTLLQLISLMSRRSDPSTEEANEMRERLARFVSRVAPSRGLNFTFCEESAVTNAEAARRPWGSALEYRQGRECIDDKAVAAVWRLEQETVAMGLWSRIYPWQDGSGDRFARFWLHNGQSEGTVGKRGPSFLQRLTAAWSELMLSEAERRWSVEEWTAALGEEEPEYPARDDRQRQEKQDKGGSGNEDEEGELDGAKNGKPEL